MTFSSSGYGGNIWKMYLFSFLVGLVFSIGVMIPFLMDWGGITFFQVMLLESWYMFWVVALGIPTGVFADYLGRKKTLALMTLFVMAGALVYSSAPNFYVFMAGEFLWAVGVALYSGAGEAFVYDSLKKTRKQKLSKKILGRMTSFGSLGLLIGASLGSIIASMWGLRMTMLLMLVPYAIAFIVALGFHEVIVRRKPKVKTYIKIMKTGIGFFYKSPVLKILAIDSIFIGTIMYSMFWLYQLVLKQANVDIAYFGLITSAFLLLEIVLMNSYGPIEKALGSKKMLITLSSLIVGLMLIVCGLVNAVPIIIISIVLCIGFGYSRGPLFSSYMNKHIKSSERATVLSAVAMIQGILIVILNPLIGLAAEWSLDYTLIILGIFALAFAFISRLKEEHLID